MPSGHGGWESDYGLRGTSTTEDDVLKVQRPGSQTPTAPGDEDGPVMETSSVHVGPVVALGRPFSPTPPPHLGVQQSVN